MLPFKWKTVAALLRWVPSSIYPEVLMMAQRHCFHTSHQCAHVCVSCVCCVVCVLLCMLVLCVVLCVLVQPYMCVSDLSMNTSGHYLRKAKEPWTKRVRGALKSTYWDLLLLNSYEQGIVVCDLTKCVSARSLKQPTVHQKKKKELVVYSEITHDWSCPGAVW